MREFVAFNTNYETQLFDCGKVDNQNLHGIAQADMVIVSHPNFLTHAATLSDFHQNDADLNVVILAKEKGYELTISIVDKKSNEIVSHITKTAISPVISK